MAVDESFKKPGSIPFKWEVRPGVPKVRPGPAKSPQHHHQPPPSSAKTRHFPSPQKLKPPPSSPRSGAFFYPPQEPARSRSFLSAPRTRSQRLQRLVQPDIVVSGCFSASPLPMMLRKKAPKKKAEPKTKATSEADPDYISETELSSSRWSVSSRNSLSPFSYASPMSTYSSFRSSPRVVSDAEWAGFGLF